ncbi:hypothetical protein QTP88_020024 [Uroleucon formosanum]
MNCNQAVLLIVYNLNFLSDIDQFLNSSKKHLISCYFEEKQDDSLLELNPEEVTKNSIFFVETSCNHKKGINLSLRQGCAIESAANLNPNLNIFVLFLAPSFISNESEIINRFKMYSNVNLRYINFVKYSHNTPLQDFVASNIISKSQWPVSHASDLLRFLTLWKFGGTYLDLDVVLMKSLEGLKNFASIESNTSVASLVLNFDVDKIGRTVSNTSINDFASNYRANNWGYNGPGVITRTLEKICDTNLVTDMNKQKCNGFMVFGTEAFCPISWSDWRLYFNTKTSDEVMLKIKDSIGIHVWNLHSLRKDILNSFYHILGSHAQCEDYFCHGPKLNENNFVDDAEKSKVIDEITQLANRLVTHADSLLMNVDNNVCEQFNSIINKHLSGDIGKKYLKTKRMKSEKRKCKKLLFSKKVKKFSKQTGPDQHYGLAEPLLDDIPLNELESKKSAFIQSLYLDHDKRIELEIKTREQANSQIWHTERRNRITGSNFGRICKMRPTTLCRSTVYDMLYRSFTSKSTDYGKAMENKAIIVFQNGFNCAVEPCGLIVDDDLHYLAATPDGLVGTDYVVEIKCPLKAKDSSSFIEAVMNKKITFCRIQNENEMELKKKHNYYYQIQGQMHVSKRKFCYFVVYTANWYKVQIIEYDESFWSNKMVSKLEV